MRIVVTQALRNDAKAYCGHSQALENDAKVCRGHFQALENDAKAYCGHFQALDRFANARCGHFQALDRFANARWRVEKRLRSFSKKIKLNIYEDYQLFCHDEMEHYETRCPTFYSNYASY